MLAVVLPIALVAETGEVKKDVLMTDIKFFPTCICYGRTDATFMPSLWAIFADQFASSITKTMSRCYAGHIGFQGYPDMAGVAMQHSIFVQWMF